MAVSSANTPKPQIPDEIVSKQAHNKQHCEHLKYYNTVSIKISIDIHFTKMLKNLRESLDRLPELRSQCRE